MFVETSITMKRLRFSLFVSLFGLALLASCGKYNTNLNELPSSTSDWVLPLVKGQVSFETIRELSKVNTSFDVPSLDIGYASGIAVNVPAITIPEVGPYKQPLSNWIHSIQFDTLDIKLSFTNSFPIAIGSGTKFSFRRTDNTADPNNIIYQHTVASDILPAQQYEFDVQVFNNSVSDTIYLFLEQFTSPGGNNVTFGTTPSKINVEVKVIDIKKVELFPNRSVVERDTVDIDFGEEETSTGPVDTSSHATVKFFIDHAMPIHVSAQVYFLHPTSNIIIDSLLSPAVSAVGCNTDALGDPLNVNSSNTSIYISNSRIETIKKSKRGIVTFRLNTNGYPGPYVNLSDKTYLKLQITGDLHLSFNLNSI
jgi:hypothetical protein